MKVPLLSVWIQRAQEEEEEEAVFISVVNTNEDPPRRRRLSLLVWERDVRPSGVPCATRRLLVRYHELGLKVRGVRARGVCAVVRDAVICLVTVDLYANHGSCVTCGTGLQ